MRKLLVLMLVLSLGLPAFAAAEAPDENPIAGEESQCTVDSIDQEVEIAAETEFPHG